MAAEKYTGRSNGFELVAVSQKDEDYTAEIFGGPAVIPSGDGICLALRREKKYVSFIRPKGSPRDAAAIAERLVYPIHRALRGTVRPKDGMTLEEVEAFSTTLDERLERRQDWTRKVRPLVEDALAALGAEG